MREEKDVERGSRRGRRRRKYVLRNDMVYKVMTAMVGSVFWHHSSARRAGLVRVFSADCVGNYAP